MVALMSQGWVFVLGERVRIVFLDSVNGVMSTFEVPYEGDLLKAAAVIFGEAHGRKDSPAPKRSSGRRKLWEVLLRILRKGGGKCR